MNQESQAIVSAPSSSLILPPAAPPVGRAPAWRAAGYGSTLVGVLCLMAAAHGLSEEVASANMAGGYIALGGAAFFFVTGFRLLRERTVQAP